MDYELAKQLKDSGFPEISSEDCDDEHVCCLHQFNIPSDRETYYPSLSELIEACGDFYGLFKEAKNNWSAHSNSMNPVMPAIAKCIGRGKTPQEALAKLWLALNKQ